MKNIRWGLGIAIGTVIGFVAGCVMTVLDWRLNPGDLFHNDSGTSWGVVAETFASWFFPIALLASATIILVSAISASLSRRDN